MVSIQEKKSAVEQFITGLAANKKHSEALCMYVYDLKQLKNHVVAIKDSLPDFCRLYYAMKANPDPQILKAIANTVDGFEAASAGEIKTVMQVSSKSILFGAPAKKDYEIEHIVCGDTALVNIESLHDANRLQFAAHAAGKKVPVVIRVNLREKLSDSFLKMSGIPSQFGVDEMELPILLLKMKECSNLEIKGFHFHAMSNNLDAAIHVKFIALCIEKALMWQEKYGINVSIVNVGGGVGINYSHPHKPFDWDQLSEGLHILDQAYRNKGVELILELGRYMVAECGFYATEVLDLKENHGECFALVRGGTHHLRLPAAWKINHPFTVLSIEKWNYPFDRPCFKNKKVSIAGELCTPNDVLAKNVQLTELKAGDQIIFQLAGAYGWTISHHDFLSHPHPNVYYLE